MQARSRSKSLPAEQRRAATVDAVITLAATQNPTEITTAAIAREMAVTQGALFRHFPTKEAILHAVMVRVCDQLLSRLDRAVEKMPSPWAALEAMFSAHIDYVARHPGIPRILFAELQRAGDTPTKQQARILLERYQSRLCHLISAARKDGVVAPEVDPMDAAGLFIGSIQGLVMRSLLGGGARQMRKCAPGVWTLYSRALRNSS